MTTETLKTLMAETKTELKSSQIMSVMVVAELQLIYENTEIMKLAGM